MSEKPLSVEKDTSRLISNKGLLLLNGQDMRRAASPGEIVEAVSEALKIEEKKTGFMPTRTHTEWGDHTLLMMPSFADKVFGIKLITVSSNNPARGLPAIQGIMVLNEGQSGRPLAIFNGTALTALRTGAVGALSIRLLARPDARILGIIGTGMQGLHQARFAIHERQFHLIIAYDPNPTNRETFASIVKGEFPESEIRFVSSEIDVCRGADVIITATPSMTPVLPDDPGMLEGKHVIGIGSYKPEMMEFSPALYSLVDPFYVDTNHACRESGDVLVPLEKKWLDPSRVIPLGKLILDPETYAPKTSTTAFKSVGMALFDLITASLIYRKALDAGIGQEAVWP